MTQPGSASADRGRSEGGGGAAIDERWIETREGGLFFVNALFIFPAFMVLLPLLLRVLIRSGGGLGRFSPILDTFPSIAEYFLPRIGWLLLLPIGLVAYNLSLERGFVPRLGLALFLLIHLSFLCWTVGTWAGLFPPILPGGPPPGGTI